MVESILTISLSFAKRKGLIGYFAAVKEAAAPENGCAQGREEAGCLTGTYLIRHSSLLPSILDVPTYLRTFAHAAPSLYLQCFSLLHLTSTSILSFPISDQTVQ